MKKIRVIINPIAGTRSKQQIPALVQNALQNPAWQVEICYTEARGHATVLAAEAAALQYDAAIAVGGDGTVNEVAKGLVGTATALGIIPMGSGNGLARHLQIPMNTGEAIAHIRQSKISVIDSCTLNEQPFFCTAGLGFDAHIADLFAQQKTRGLSTYVKTTFKAFFDYKPQDYTLFIDGAETPILRNALLVTCANAAQFGNNAYIAPKANIADGLIEICILKPFPLSKAGEIALRLFNKTLDKCDYMEFISCKKVRIERANTGAVHLDGEPNTQETSAEVIIKPLSLRVLA
jgi:diacylglycerol kinase (ATP)